MIWVASDSAIRGTTYRATDSPARTPISACAETDGLRVFPAPDQDLAVFECRLGFVVTVLTVTTPPVP